MRRKTVARVAWSLWTLVALGTVAGLVVGATDDPSPDLLIFAGTTLTFATIGLVIALRAGNVIGWIFISLAAAFVLSSIADEYVQSAELGSLVLVWAAWVSSWSLVMTGVALPLILLLFPTGRPLSRRWRPLLWALAIATVAMLIGLMFRPGELNVSERVTVQNPLGIPALEGILSFLVKAGAAAAFFVGFASIASVIVRYRKARGEERQQLRWFVYVVFLAGTAFFLLFVLSRVFGEDLPGWMGSVGDVLWMAFVLLIAIGIPASVTIALLKYRLYDIDVVISKTVVYGMMAGFITLIYVLIVAGVGAVAGSASNTFLSAIAAAVVALAFQPVRRRAQHIANRFVYGKRATPYEVLSEFSEQIGGTYASEDILPRMARILAEGTGAVRADVWLVSGSSLSAGSTWPADAPALEPVPVDPMLPAMIPVRHQGELLGALSVEKPATEGLTSTEATLIEDLASQAGLVLRNVALTEQLLARLDDLRASRQRLVTAQDGERRKIERDLHDGAQQQLVALSVKLRITETMIDKDIGTAREMLGQAQEETREALETLRDLARGIYPPVLADQGLLAALESQARKASVAVTVDGNGIGRYPQEAESAVYFCCLEALQNIAKYANADRAVIELAVRDGELTFVVSDDGRGFDPSTTARGAGTTNMADRIDALGGSFAISSTPGEGTTVTGRIPTIGQEADR